MSNSTETHPSLHDLQEFASGRDCSCPEVIEDHLANCETCAATLSAFDATLQLTQQIGTALRSQPSALSSREQLLSRIREQLEPGNQPSSAGRLAHYELMELVGHGAYGLVFRAVDESLNREVAIKILSPDFSGSFPARQRFVREARSAAAIRHGNVVGIYAVAEQPLPYLVMEFVPGTTLQCELDRGRKFSAKQVASIGIQIASGLQAAHSLGLIHRDVKPANILLQSPSKIVSSSTADGTDAAKSTPEFHVRLSDFGLARSMDFASTMTTERLVVGTPAYMSPEQVHGEHLDQRTDLFSLGSLLYTLCTGHAPFAANSLAALLLQVSNAKARPIEEVAPETPEALKIVIQRLMLPDRALRYQSADEVILDLTRVQNDQPLESAAIATPSSLKSGSPTGNHGSWKRSIALTAFAVLAMLGVLLIRASETEFVVTTNDPEIATRIDKSGGILVENLTTRTTYTLKAGPNKLPHGDYELIVTSPDGLELTTPKFQLRRFGTDITTSIVARSKTSDANKERIAHQSGEMSETPPLLPTTELSFEEPQPVPFLDGNASGSNPSVTGDGLRIIFVRRRESESNGIFEAVRSSVDEPFSAPTPFSFSFEGFDPVPVETLGTPFLSNDGRELLVYAIRPENEKVDLCQTSRATLDEPWAPLTPLEGSVNDDRVKYAPTIRHDGLELLWFRPEPENLYDGNIWLARRSSLDAPFENAHQLAGPINTSESEQHPCLSHDGLLLAFDRGTPDPRLWYSTRSSTADDFSHSWPISLPESWRDRNAYAPSLMADQSMIFFTSNTVPGREGFDSGQLWFARRRKPDQ